MPWTDQLPAELKEHKALKDIKDVAGLAKTFIDTQAMIGNSIRIPSAEASSEAVQEFHQKLMDKVPGLIRTPDPAKPEEMNALYKRMGRPDAPDGYELPEGVDGTKVADFAKQAHALGLTKSQFKSLLEHINLTNKTRQEESAQNHATELRKLKQEWGIVYEDKMELVQAVMQLTGAPPEMQEMAADGKLPVGVIRWMHEIGERLGTEGLHFDKDSPTTRLTPREAQAQINEMMNNREGPYWVASHPGHKEAVQKMYELHRAVEAGR